MENSFNDKLHRLGYRITINEPRKIELTSTKGKVISGLILAIVGLFLMPFFITTYKGLSSFIQDNQLGMGLGIFLIYTVLGIFGFISFIRGSDRFFEYLGFKIVIDNSIASVTKSVVFKKETYTLEGVSNIFLDEGDNKVVIYCQNKIGEKKRLISEKELFVSGKSTLLELADLINKKI